MPRPSYAFANIRQTNKLTRLSTLESDPAGLTLERLLALASILGLEIVVRDRATAPAARRKPEW